MLISRRNLLLAGAATVVTGCASTHGVRGPDAVVDDPPATIDPQEAEEVLARPNPDVRKVPKSVTMVGDSISALSEKALDPVLEDMGFETVTINAEPSRRIQIGRKNPTNGLDIIRYVAGADSPEMWVIELGTNDAGLYTTDDDYQDLIDSVLDVIDRHLPLVWVSTYREDHLDGCIRFNDLLRRSLVVRGNATVADWYLQCVASASEILTHDGVHPNSNGILVFADTVRAAIATRLA